MTRTLWRNVVIKIILNINIRSVLIFDRNLVGGDEVVRSSSFSACCDVGRSCHSAILRGDHHCDVVWWSELGGAARDMVWWSGGWSSAEPLGTWSGGLVVGARRSRLGRGLGGVRSPSKDLDEGPSSRSHC